MLECSSLNRVFGPAVNKVTNDAYIDTRAFNATIITGVVAAITAFSGAVVGIVKAFGVTIDESILIAVLGLVGIALIALAVVVAADVLARSRVKVGKLALEAAKARIAANAAAQEAEAATTAAAAATQAGASAETAAVAATQAAESAVAAAQVAITANGGDADDGELLTVLGRDLDRIWRRVSGSD